MLIKQFASHDGCQQAIYLTLKILGLLLSLQGLQYQIGESRLT